MSSREPSIAWPAIDTVWASLGGVNQSFNIRDIDTSDIADVIQLVHAWYPGVAVGSESVFLSEAFYRAHVALEDCRDCRDRAIRALVIESEGRIIGFAAMELDARARALRGRLVVIAPAHRGAGLAEFVTVVIGEIGRLVGAEILISYTTLRHPFSQRLLERLGYQLVGIVPGHDRDLIAPGQTARVFEALYVKLIAESETVEPRREAMTATTARLFDALFR